MCDSVWLCVCEYVWICVCDGEEISHFGIFCLSSHRWMDGVSKSLKSDMYCLLLCYVWIAPSLILIVTQCSFRHCVSDTWLTLSCWILTRVLWGRCPHLSLVDEETKWERLVNFSKATRLVTDSCNSNPVSWLQPPDFFSNANGCSLWLHIRINPEAFFNVSISEPHPQRFLFISNNHCIYIALPLTGLKKKRLKHNLI